MDNFIADRMKKIRQDNNLTQKQFAKIFYVTEKAISNYENAVRTPTLEFLKKVCDKFHVTLDYFSATDRKESDPKNLIITIKNGKKALFDVAQSLYLSSHEYDDIFISECGYHIAIKKDENGKIIYSIIFDNCGQGRVFNNIIFGYGGGFDKHGNALAECNGKTCLVNYNGDVVRSVKLQDLTID